MPDDSAPKSAFELAMERLRKRDAESGDAQQPLTDAQRAQIAEIRNFYESKIAEQEILHRSRLATLWDPEERGVVEQELRRDRERLTSERDSKIAKIREQS